MTAADLLADCEQANELADSIRLFFACFVFVGEVKKVEQLLKIEYKKVMRRSSSSSRVGQFNLTGMKGSWESNLQVVARNTNGFWYLVTDDADSHDWVQTDVPVAARYFPILEEQLRDLKAGTVAVLDIRSMRWRRIVYDWMPERDSPVPDFASMMQLDE